MQKKYWLLLKFLDAVADEQGREWWGHQIGEEPIEFRGAFLPRITEMLAHWFTLNSIQRMSLKGQLEIALDLIGERYVEDRIAGIKLINRYIIPHINPRRRVPWQGLILRSEDLFRKGCLEDSITCEWFSKLVLGELIRNNGSPCAEAVLSWRHAENPWQASASVLAFLHLVREGDHVYEGLALEAFNACSVVIKREECFPKKAVGQLLGSMPHTSADLVAEFIETHIKYFSEECLEASVTSLSCGEKERLKVIFKGCRRK